MDLSADVRPSAQRRRSATGADSALETSAPRTDARIDGGLPDRLQVNGAVDAWPTRMSLLASDLFGAFLLLMSGWLVSLSRPDGGLHGTAPIEGLPTALLLAVVLGTGYAVSGLYRLRFMHPATEMKQMAKVTVTAGAAVVITLLLTAYYSAAVSVAILTVIAVLLMPVARTVVRVALSRLSWWGIPSVIIGPSKATSAVAETLTTWPEIGLRPVARLIDEDRRSAPETSGDGHAAVETGQSDGAPAWAAHLSREHDLPVVIMADESAPGNDQARESMHYARFFDRVVRVTPPHRPAVWRTGRAGRGLQSDVVNDGASHPVPSALKRMVDITGAVLILTLISPLLLTISLLIRLDSDGPILYRQERMGKTGRTFTLLKFRSMYDDAEGRLEQVLKNDPKRRREYEKYRKLRDDPRVTDVGHVLRRYSLDELPQLLNVLRGDMSLVGPRAYMPEELPKMKGLERVILRTPPGVTGLWQVSGRNELTFEKRVDLDVHYVQNWSPWLDLYLLIRTVPTVLLGEGAG
ncbi:exopolysaccharide biosynthesis polyprenyl glycosylphosphotransferase [Longibacter sp.]|uniref:exopolysaccharide biosynthesis polyprenyl glycosylphosphotransferase n=1 Tax=Longibacter sp. TaxID=2045415 RepID=UPI003EBEB691